MALTRKALKAMGLTDEQVDSIIEMHGETVDGLKAERDGYKNDAGKLTDTLKRLEEAEKQLKENGKDSWKVKYDAIKEEFEGFKSETTRKATRAAKETAYRALLRENGVSDKRLDAVLRVTDLEKLEMNGDQIKDRDKVSESIKTEWADFIPSVQERALTFPPRRRTAEKSILMTWTTRHITRPSSAKRKEATNNAQRISDHQKHCKTGSPAPD